MKTALEILNQVEPNGELLDTDQALEAMELYAVEYAKSLKEDKWISVEEKVNKLLRAITAIHPSLDMENEKQPVFSF